MKTPNTIPDLIDAFGGSAKFSRVIGKNPSTASEMKRNNSIRVIYWPAIIEAAPDHGISGVTLESIAQMHLSASQDEVA